MEDDLQLFLNPKTHRLAATFRPLTGKALPWLLSVGGIDRKQVNILSRKMNVRNQTVMAQQLGPNISRTAALVECFPSAVVSTDQMCWTCNTAVDAHGERSVKTGAGIV